MTEAEPLSDHQPLPERVSSLRRGHRHALLIGLSVALAAHVALFALNPGFAVPNPGTVTAAAPMDIILPRPTSVIVDGRPSESEASWPVVLTNHGAVVVALDRLWPRAYKRVGEGGTAALRLTLADDGTVEHVELAEGSGDLAKDGAFIKLARHFRFSVDVGSKAATQIVVAQPVIVSARQ